MLVLGRSVEFRVESVSSLILFLGEWGATLDCELFNIVVIT